ncbi:HD-GYP domain-containing protein [Phosphitispora sp. TUW77]|uniref:HD-GYP domain-containing protein n=1 Tax=Phosphitispora sp. TUW77 TaxID=3152361 RepID=UPI003AB4CCBC
MRKIDLATIKVGSKISKTIYNSKGHVLLKAGTVLTDRYIKRLQELGFTSIFIDDGLIDDINIEEAISENTRINALNCIRDIMQEVKRNKIIHVAPLKKAVNNIIDDLLTNKDIMLNLSDIRSYDDYTFNHSVNVTVISTFIGMSLHYRKDRLKDLGMGVLLHDVGKTQIPLEIINKPGRLTEEEYEIVKKHTWYGFDTLRKCPGIKLTSAHVALQHHERLDGTGYPRNLKGKRIIEFARISAIADVYDAMTSDRCYRKSIPVHEVCHYLAEGSGVQFDQHILDRFIEKVAIYPQGTRITLSDGRSGIVIKQNTGIPARPVIRLFWNEKGPLPKPVQINLADNLELNIEDVIE